MKKTIMKWVNRAAVLGLVAAPALVHAEDATPTDTSKIVSAVNKVGKAAQDGLEAAADTATPYITGALLVTIGVFVIPLIWRWIKRIFGR